MVEALNEGRRCLILSQWTEHCHLLADGLRARGVSPLILEGSLGKGARAAIIEQIGNSPPGEQLVIVATGRYLGEGFDSPQLDALFLVFPVLFTGRLVQYTGRLMRAEEGKTTVRVYDYADIRVPVLRAMHTRRRRTYKSLGFTRDPNRLQGSFHGREEPIDGIGRQPEEVEILGLPLHIATRDQSGATGKSEVGCFIQTRDDLGDLLLKWAQHRLLAVAMAPEPVSPGLTH